MTRDLGRRGRMRGGARVALALELVFLGTLWGCEAEPGGAYARRIVSTNDLIGGPGALGTVGDWVLGNQEIRVILQDQGWSRGFGIFGGGIIDADLVRPGEDQASTGFGRGMDNFGEFFPGLFLQAFDVSDQVTQDLEGNLITEPGIEIIADGSDGGPAIIRTRAAGGDFFTLIKELIDVALPSSGLRFETDYILEPGARYVKIVGRLINTSQVQSLRIPDPGLLGLLGLFGVSDFSLPLGEVALFGTGNTVFAPGAVHRPDNPSHPRPIGFDLRFGVEASYELVRDLPALPGIVTPFLATAGPGVSYGFAVGDSDRNFVWMNRDQYGADPQFEVTKHSMLVPFLISSFTGAFYEVPPEEMAPEEVYEYTKYFIVGGGDVASIRDVLFEIRGTPTGAFYGRVLNEQAGTPAADTWVHIFDERRRPFNQVQPDQDGRFRALLPAGTYYWVVTGEGRYPFAGAPYDVAASADERFTERNRFVIGRDPVGGDGTVLGDVHRQIYVPRPAEVHVTVRDPEGRPLPAKVSVLLPYTPPPECLSCTSNCDRVCAPHHYLFDFSLGERRRYTDLNWRDRPARSGQYVEAVFLGHDGEVQGELRPNPCRLSTSGERVACTPYTVVVSRGMEYDTVTFTDVVVNPGEVRRFEATLDRVLDTTHYVGADLHIHAQPSADSSLSLDDRVISGAAEGVEVLVATDHNAITDYEPTIASLHLQDWVTGVVGVELTTLEAGHFNAFPVELDASIPTRFPFVSACFEPEASRVNRTSFDWVQCAPQQFFDNLRSLGAFGERDTIVQVNHPRDTILGYFNQYYVNPYTLNPEFPTGANYPFSTFLYPHNPTTGQFQPDKFSWDFDAIEIFNGKRLDLVHSFRTPVDAPQDVVNAIRDTQCGDGHQLNGPGQILLRQGGHVVYPGAFDDWLRLLNRGFTFVATANSDTHSLDEEIGSPRTFLYIEPNLDGSRRDDHVGTVHPLDVVDALHNKRAVGTNGPFLTMTVLNEGISGGGHIGSTVSFPNDHRGRDVRVQLRVQSAPWVDVNRIVVYANGQVIDTIHIPEGTTSTGRAIDDDFSLPRTYRFSGDTVLVAEAFGSESLFPVVPPNETPPANLNEAVGALLSGLGTTFGTNDGVSGPSFVQRVTPYGFTNPIWLDVTGPGGPPDGVFSPPGNLPGPGPAVGSVPGVCGVDLSCPPGQTCDTSQAPPQCVCADPVAAVPPPTRMLYSTPEAGTHFGRYDIRKVFGAAFACGH